MTTRIEIDTKTFVRFWLVVCGFLLAGLLVYAARGALVLLGIAFFVALALSRPVNWLAKKLPGNSRLGATAAAYLAIVLFLIAIIFLVIPPIIEQSAKLADTVPALVSNAQRQWTGLNDLVVKYNLQPQIDQALNNVKNSFATLASSAGQGFISGIGSVVTFCGTATLVLFMAFFMLVEGPDWIRRMWALYDDKETMKRHEKLAVRMYNTVTNFVSGQLKVSSIDAVVAGVGVLVLTLCFHSVPANLILPVAALAFLLSLIPMFGSTIGMIISASLIALNNLPAGIIYAVYFIIYQQIEGNVLVPMIQSKANNLTALIILVAVTTGLWMFGLIGGIIAIPIASSIKILVEDHIEKVQEDRERRERRQQRERAAQKIVAAKD